MPVGSDEGGIRGTVVVVIFNARDAVFRCLGSIPVEVRNQLKVIVVDNGSSDGAADMAAREFPWIKLIKSNYNGGFGAGNNIGIRHIKGRWCLFLNPDTYLQAEALTPLEKCLFERPVIGAVAPAVLELNGSGTVSYYPFTRPLYSTFVALGLHRILPLNRRGGRWVIDRRPNDKSCRVESAIGAALMVRREAIERVGGFDEQFFLYCEEEDLCRRLDQNGWEVVYCPQAEVIHEGARSTGNSPLSTAAVNWSRYLYLKKWHTDFGAECSRWVWIAALSLRWLVTIIIGRHTKAEGYRLALKSLLSPGWFDRCLRPPRGSV